MAVKRAGKFNAISIKRNQKMRAEKFIHVSILSVNKETKENVLVRCTLEHHLQRKAARALPLWSYLIALYLFVYQPPG